MDMFDMNRAPPIERIIFLPTGDFLAAAGWLANGGGETYHAQEYSMLVVEEMARTYSNVTVVSISAETRHDEILPSGVRSIGLKNIWKKSGHLKAYCFIWTVSLPPM